MQKSKGAPKYFGAPLLFNGGEYRSLSKSHINLTIN